MDGKMLRWIASKLLKSKRIVDYNLFEIEKCITAARNLDTNTRKKMARDYFATLENYYNLVPKENPRHLNNLAQFAKSKRQEALRLGAASYLDPLWNAAATIETIATTLYLEQIGNITTKDKDSILTIIGGFIDENLTASEIDELTKLVANQ
jgi:hypothetical protein